ncbi:ACR136Cp [Eremothecium gossypii ATCC 10895]|uniref:ACR136Cp n=1 Tax=Eremothecium gossypii (strain ATCC 10895 / CBS 109.51 / FGSC 9923 / NRRL Y-1056) TaxID=284811 RepID=Q75BY4_EREGS|nr:ACR136Cp [Eremothecium gossypii ATCC 10895]AAS51362.1 ACR136Cp [Eremothecium gossypii ATCC 10895]AEY95653.1 FACR136Cp [Eremothecium gossypii FDAG1]
MSQENLQKRAVEADHEAVVAKKAKTEDDGLKEIDVGITEYLSAELPGFSGQIKQRYSDFMVNEIQKDGTVVYLRDNGFKMPAKPKPSADQVKAQQAEERERRHNHAVEAELRNQLVELLGEEDMQQIEAVYRNVTKMETTRSFDDKAARTKIHQLLRKAFNNELESVTSASNTFQIALANRKTRVSKEDYVEQTRDENGVINWGYGPSKNCVHFTMYKENKDTMDVVNIIAKFLRVPTKAIRFAGTKDRRAVTCQRLSIGRIGLDRINALNNALKGVVLGGFSFEDEPLSLGDLNGNEFVIVIRDVSTDPNSATPLESILDRGCELLKNRGFINYFGMQRFGTFSVSTHEVGKELLLENWKNAVDLILSEQNNVLPASKEARKIWAETGDAESALRKMPRQCLAENSILHTLATQKKNEGEYESGAYYAAIMKIPRNLRTMYVHAYQSYVWNTVTSKRMALFGLHAVAGDLVLVESDENAKVNIAEDSEDADDSEFSEDLRGAQFVRAKALTEEDIASGKWTIDDVVLPTPGFDTTYPENETLKALYKEIMTKDGLDPFDMRRKVRDFSLAGSYRHILQKTKDITYQIIHYKDSTQQLINSDFEILKNKRAKENGRNYMKDKLDRICADKGGDKTAVVLKFKLGVSAYATMALRELMKAETSRRGDLCSVRTASGQV